LHPWSEIHDDGPALEMRILGSQKNRIALWKNRVTGGILSTLLVKMGLQEITA
jgi:hypothetical protein